MEGNSIAMASSTPAPSAIAISSSPSNDSMDHSIVLETVPDESTIEAAEAVVALGSDLKHQKHFCIYGANSDKNNSFEIIQVLYQKKMSIILIITTLMIKKRKKYTITWNEEPQHQHHHHPIESYLSSKMK
mmetsp:Transcript_13753/g.20336  ORF Transcript_13753/g.20336 Transcript_13753/m.20336 type:complete len:131 (+) Transcript_13753:487-879(+)